MELKLKYNIYPTLEIEELINCCEDPVDYIIEKSRMLINGDCWDNEAYVSVLMEKFAELNNLLGLFPDKEVVEAVLRFKLDKLTEIDKYKEFKKSYSNEDWIEIEVNAEIDLNVFKIEYDKYIAIEIMEK